MSATGATGEAGATGAAGVAGEVPGVDGAAPDGPVSREAFREAMGGFATAVTVVTSRGRHPHAMTANSVASVSLDPALLLVCLAQDARVHDAVLEDGRFGVSVLAAGQERVARWLSTPGRPQVAQLSQVPTVTGPVLGLPLVAGSLLRLECEVDSAHPAGDHTVVVGAVRGVQTTPGQPLVWFARGYRGLSAQV